MQKLSKRHLMTNSACNSLKTSAEYQETNRVEIRAVLGLWVVLAFAVAAAILYTLLLSVWCWNKRRGLRAAGHDVEAGIEERAKLVVRELSHAMFNSLRCPSRQPSLSGDMASRAGSSDDRAPSFTCPYSGGAGSGASCHLPVCLLRAA
jgi:hypothetical protein